MPKPTQFLLRFVRLDRPERSFAFPCGPDGTVLEGQLDERGRLLLEACREAEDRGLHMTYVEGVDSCAPATIAA